MNRILRLLADNRKAPRAFSASADAGADEATLYLYDVIVSSALEAEYWGGVAPETFAKELAAITASTIHLRINSPGGDVFAAQAMVAAIRQQKAKVICHVDGYAASAATVIAIACDEVRIADGAFFMVHNSWTVAFGNADDLMETAALLEKVDGSLASAYAAKCDKPVDEIKALMDAETWMTGQEAVDAGFCDALDEAPAKAEAKAWNLSAYGKAPKAEAPVEPPVEPPAAKPASTSNTEHLRRRLALHERTA